MPKQTKTVITPSLIVLATEIEEHVKAGWSVDLETHPPVMVGFQYEVEFHREVKEGEQPKLTRAEILQKAREAKAAKVK